MSVRNFERVFTHELGRTPSKYVLQVRVEAARHRLERTDRGLKQIAVACRFGSADAMRRSFVRFVGITPKQYRHGTRLQPVRNRPTEKQNLATAHSGYVAPNRTQGRSDHA
jgi:transcriptional regulator GlxA family with amidase domain